MKWKTLKFSHMPVARFWCWWSPNLILFFYIISLSLSSAPSPLSGVLQSSTRKIFKLYIAICNFQNISICYVSSVQTVTPLLCCCALPHQPHCVYYATQILRFTQLFLKSVITSNYSRLHLRKLSFSLANQQQYIWTCNLHQHTSDARFLPVNQDTAVVKQRQRTAACTLIPGHPNPSRTIRSCIWLATPVTVNGDCVPAGPSGISNCPCMDFNLHWRMSDKWRVTI